MKVRYLLAATVLMVQSTTMAGMSQSTPSDKLSSPAIPAWVGEPINGCAMQIVPGSVIPIQLAASSVDTSNAKGPNSSQQRSWMDRTRNTLALAANPYLAKTEVEQNPVVIPLPPAAPVALMTLGMIALAGYLRRLRRAV